mmetsp:Transcript_89336/g.216726  ORF Transcript_89336/g.216726 Transcript_89336/m.216726 type:complete len:363 (-) Transcript_89336:23-1111(-)
MPRPLRKLPKLLWVWPLACAAWAGRRRQSPEPLDTVALLQTAKSQHTEALEGRGGPEPEGEERTGRVLVFWAVGSKPRAIQLVRQNVELLREEVRQAESSSTPLSLDVFLAHYDHNRSFWRGSAEAAQWYGENVQFSVEGSGYKFKLANHWLLHGDATSGPQLSNYEWLWILDEDAGFSRGLKLQTLVREARASGALILGPAVVSAPDQEIGVEAFAESERSSCSPSDGQCMLQAPDPRCRYRYTNFVEVMFPFMKPSALREALAGCPDCLHETSVWGLDLVWCAMAAQGLARSQESVCAIVDRAQVVHENLQTLDKYKGTESERKAKHWSRYQDIVNVWHSHSKEFQLELRVLECVPEDSP